MRIHFSKPLCNECGSLTHYTAFCYAKANKPVKRSNKPITKESAKARHLRRQTAKRWLAANPPASDGYWTCYLQISSLCPQRLSRPLLTLEHVEPKVRRPDLKYDINNIRPSCPWCNKLKSSRTLEELAKIWPHLLKYI